MFLFQSKSNSDFRLDRGSVATFYVFVAIQPRLHNVGQILFSMYYLENLGMSFDNLQILDILGNGENFNG